MTEAEFKLQDIEFSINAIRHNQEQIRLNLQALENAKRHGLLLMKYQTHLLSLINGQPVPEQKP